MSRHLVSEVLIRMDYGTQFITRGREQSFVSGLMEMTSLSSLSQEQQRALAAQKRSEMMSGYGYSAPVADKPFAFQSGTAVIPIQGSLLNRFSGSWGFVTGYNAIRAQRNAAMDDSEVELIVYDCNSHGGEAAGCLELAEEIRLDRGKKPQLAMVDSNCCSAAYALASGCDKIYATSSSSVGSIGVMSMHMNIQKALEQDGIEVTLITSGSHKADANRFQALSPEVRADIQADNDYQWEKFIALVAAGRPMSADDVRNTQAQVYRSDQALSLKLIDGIQKPADAVSSFLAELADPDPEDENETLPPEDEDQPNMAATPEELEAARNEGRNEGRNAGMTAATERFTAIMDSDEAKKRPALARHLALKSGMTADDVKATLAVAPVEVAAPAAPGEGGEQQQQSGGGTAFRQRMDAEGGAGVQDEPGAAGAGGAGGDQPKPDRAGAALVGIGRRKVDAKRPGQN